MRPGAASIGYWGNGAADVCAHGRPRIWCGRCKPADSVEAPYDTCIGCGALIKPGDSHQCPPDAPTILDEARAIIYGDREQTHGEPGKNLAAIASMWSPIFGTTVTPQQVCLAMIALKVARAVNSPEYRDNYVDIAGYSALVERIGVVQENK